MKKFVALFLSVLMVLGLFAACTQEKTPVADAPQSSDTTPTEKESVEATPESEVKDYSDVEFSIAWWGGDTRHQQTIEIIEAFEAMYPGLKVNVDYVGMSDYQTKIATYAAGGDLPDVMQLSYLWITDYAKNGIIAPLDSYIEDGSIDLSKCDLSVNAAGMYDDQTYAIASGANAYCLIYDPAVLEEAGVTLSQNPTMSEYVSVCKAVYEKTGKKADPPYPGFTYLSLDESLYKNGSDTVCVSPETYAAVYETEITGIEEGYFVGPADPVTWDPAADFAQGSIWCSVQFTNFMEQLEGDTGMELALTCLPTADNPVNPYPTYLQPTMMWGIANDSDQKELAAAFLSFFINNQVVYEIAGTDRGIPISSEMKAFLAEDASPSMIKVLDYLEWLGDGRLSPMNAYTPDKAADANAINDAFREECRYLQVPKEDLLDRANEVIAEMNAALAG